MDSTHVRADLASARDPLHHIHVAGAEFANDALRRVLIFDDEETIRLALSRFLRLRGYEVETAPSATVALETLKTSKFALMLSDLRMPGMSGLEMLPHALAIDPDLGILMLTAVNDASSATVALSGGAFDYLIKPVELPALQTAVDGALRRRSQGMERRAVDRLIREEVATRTMELEREKTALRKLTVSIAETLINAMEAKDMYLRGHSQRVAELGVAIAAELELGHDIAENVRIAGRLHDVGKIGIREEVLNKPGPLSADEYEHVKDHVRIGMDILAPLQHLGDALEFIHDHHEHWNGQGYPRALAGKEIWMGGRILTAADAFDALTSKRAYRQPMSSADTLEYLRTQAGSLIEPAVFKALANVVHRSDAGETHRAD